MSLFPTHYGEYDDTGNWRQSKFCLVPCDRCDCGPPNGEWYSAEHDKRKQKDDNNQCEKVMPSLRQNKR